jgi:bifunctional non-homologous end joining protein LigD
MNKIKTVKLFFQEGTSDKLYHATLWEDGGLYTVEVEWGKRGTTLNRGNKAIKVTLAAAEKTIEKLLREKTQKGYQEITEEVAPQAVAPPVGQGSASRVAKDARKRMPQAAQLLNPLEESELEKFLSDEKIIAQQKLDGVRILAHRVDTTEGIIATNRSGQHSTIDETIQRALLTLPQGSILDGEVVPSEKGPVYWLFDLLQHGAENLRSLGYAARYQKLSAVAGGLQVSCVGLVTMAETQEQKRALLKRLQDERAEGIVFKQRDAAYQEGRPPSGGTQRKYKFIKSADVIITSNAGNAYQMAVYEGKNLREIGKVFAGTTNESRKQLDELLGANETPVAEVRYLYATDDDQLFQPTFVQIRDDKEAEECLLSQLEHTNKAVASTPAKSKKKK